MDNNYYIIDSGFRYFVLLVRPVTVSNPKLISRLSVDYVVEDADRNVDTQPLFEREVTVQDSRKGLTSLYLQRDSTPLKRFHWMLYIQSIICSSLYSLLSLTVQ